MLCKSKSYIILIPTSVQHRPGAGARTGGPKVPNATPIRPELYPFKILFNILRRPFLILFGDMQVITIYYFDTRVLRIILLPKYDSCLID